MSVPWIVMRSRNDAAILPRTLAGLRAQRHPFRLLVLDNASNDGSTALVRAAADRVVDIPDGAYVPGRVLNLGMRETDGERVVFLNSDCVPLHADWLETLLAGFDAPGVDAVFGRQVARSDCLPLFSKDTEETFGDGRAHARWRHCFSMAASAIRRETWEALPFDESLRYSEDVDWTWRARLRGGSIRYVAGARVEHSHNYSLAQYYRRQRGEGEAEAHIFRWSAWESSWLRYSLLPFARQVLGDLKFAVRRGALSAALHSPALRLVQMLGRRAGFEEGRAHASGTVR